MSVQYWYKPIYVVAIVVAMMSFCIKAKALNNKADSLMLNKLTILGYYQNGYVFPTNSFLRGQNEEHRVIRNYQALSIQFLKQTSGEQPWEYLYNRPYYGFGIYGAAFTHSKEIGKPIALYGILGIPIYRRNGLLLNYTFGFGIAFDWESYGENHYNVALGAEQSVYIDAGIDLSYLFESGLQFNIGSGLTHFSNGALKKPNLGVNLFSPRIGIGFNFDKKRASAIVPFIPEFKPQTEYVLALYTGFKNVLYTGTDVASSVADKGVYYSTYGLSATCNRHITFKSKIGFGAMVDYMGAANASIKVVNGKLDDQDASLNKGIELSVFPSYELVVHKLSLLIQPGLYLYRAKYDGRTPSTYQRLGLKYNILHNVSVGINIRAYNYYISDFIEWNISYRFGNL